MKTGIELIAHERAEHVTKHHINTGMDVLHNAYGQLTVGARRLLFSSAEPFGPPMRWDKQIWQHMIKKPYKDRLIIAGALIAVEIDRIQSIDLKEGKE